MRDGGANCSSPPSYHPPEVDLSIKRPLRGLLSRAHARTHAHPLRPAPLLSAASRIKLEGVSAILNFLLNPCQRVFSRTLDPPHQAAAAASIYPSVYPSPRLRSSTLFLPPFIHSYIEKDRVKFTYVRKSILSTRETRRIELSRRSKKLENQRWIRNGYECKCLCFA